MPNFAKTTNIKFATTTNINFATMTNINFGTKIDPNFASKLILVFVAKLILVVVAKLGIVVVAKFAAELGPSYVIEELPVLGMWGIFKKKKQCIPKYLDPMLGRRIPEFKCCLGSESVVSEE